MATYMERYGVLARTLDVAFVHGHLYITPVPLAGPRDPRRTPPRALVWMMSRTAPDVPSSQPGGPPTRSIADRGAPSAEHWFAVEREQWRQRNAEIEAVDPSSLDESQLADHLRACRAARHERLPASLRAARRRPAARRAADRPMPGVGHRPRPGHRRARRRLIGAARHGGVPVDARHRVRPRLPDVERARRQRRSRRRRQPRHPRRSPARTSRRAPRRAATRWLPTPAPLSGSVTTTARSPPRGRWGCCAGRCWPPAATCARPIRPRHGGDRRRARVVVRRPSRSPSTSSTPDVTAGPSDSALDAPQTIGPEFAIPPLDALPRPLALIGAAQLATAEHMFTDDHPVGVGTDCYTGRALVVDDPTVAMDSFEPGDVIITTATSPTWNALLVARRRARHRQRWPRVARRGHRPRARHPRGHRRPDGLPAAAHRHHRHRRPRPGHRDRRQPTVNAATLPERAVARRVAHRAHHRSGPTATLPALTGLTMRRDRRRAPRRRRGRLRRVTTTASSRDGHSPRTADSDIASCSPTSAPPPAATPRSSPATTTSWGSTSGSRRLCTEWQLHDHPTSCIDRLDRHAPTGRRHRPSTGRRTHQVPPVHRAILDRARTAAGRRHSTPSPRR